LGSFEELANILVTEFRGMAVGGTMIVVTLTALLIHPPGIPGGGHVGDALRPPVHEDSELAVNEPLRHFSLLE
jgi:hypothetical protein